MAVGCCNCDKRDNNAIPLFVVVVVLILPVTPAMLLLSVVIPPIPPCDTSTVVEAAP